MLVPMRMHLEALTAKQAIDKVIAENIHGLELDQRCVELATFALALEAWRYPGAGGYRQLPALQLACSGMSINEAQKELKDLAKDNEELQGAIEWMLETFKHAPTLGSLIDPTKALKKGQTEPWEILKQAFEKKISVSNETKAIANGLYKSAELLTCKYHWVVTNVPYLSRSKQSEELKLFSEKYFPEAQNDLATVFLDRCLEINTEGGTSSIVLPQNWLFLTSYKALRKKLLAEESFDSLAWLGSGAFETISGEVVKAILINLRHEKAPIDFRMCGIEVSSEKGGSLKGESLKSKKLKFVSQVNQISNPDSKILFDLSSGELLEQFATSLKGITTGDDLKFKRAFSEFSHIPQEFRYFQSTVKNTNHIGGASNIVWYQRMTKPMQPGVYIRAKDAIGQSGVMVSQMGVLPVASYLGHCFDTNAGAILPKDNKFLPAIWCYCSSVKYNNDVREVDQALKVTNATLAKIPFDLEYWSKIAKESYPNGLPKPYSDDPTQWLFHGHPCASVTWSEESKVTEIGEIRQNDTVLQVAVARLLGYRWPAELDADMELAPEMREVIATNNVFDSLVDDDGIVCIPAIRGEKPAVDRLEAILHAAYGEQWSATVLNNLLKSVKSRDLNLWLRDKFFEQHSKLFQHRPFIWQIWDGLPDGFSALVNYHTLDYKGLERLIYTYLDDWISTQIQLEKDDNDGAELRLTAARNLRVQLEAILLGEKGLDIFVRWKSLAEQPIGWNPDLNDGVRLNIRPFMQAKDISKKGAGILRTKPSILWKKDRGTDVASAPWFDLGLEYGGKQGDRINDHHLTLAEKKSARSAN